LPLFPFLLAACSGGDSDDPGVGTVVTAVSSPVAEPTKAPTQTPEQMLKGFSWPISGACLPVGDQLMPNAPRTYRKGTHEGVDMYDVDNCASIARGTPVMAAKAGVVVRADLNYVSPTATQMQALLADPNTDASLDAFRGRQVWVKLDDDGYYVNRYAHLDGVAPGITVGTRVQAGQVIAYVGETGTPESISNPGSEYHLHFEMRVGNSYLGAGLPPAEVRRLYTTLFAP
jgi:murein DD-endopeptidase MepM/ murein hydrolase activator NlpD